MGGAPNGASVIMLMYTLQRLLAAVPSLFFVSLSVFFILHLAPGDPVLNMVGEMASPELIAATRQELGLDLPLYEQYWHWFSRLFSLDFGRSMLSGDPVLSKIIESFFVTAQIVIASVFVVALVAISAGVVAAKYHNRKQDLAIVSLGVLLMSIPSFWLGMSLIIIFGVKLQWFPTIGFVSIFDDFFAGLTFLVLPVVALAMGEVGAVLRMMRSSMLDVLSMDYIAYAKAKGLSQNKIIFRHGIKNAIPSTITLLGLILGSLLGGAAVIEAVFSIPGLGSLLIKSIYNRDYPMVQGIMVVVATSYILVNLLVDLIYPLLDPRIKI